MTILVVDAIGEGLGVRRVSDGCLTPVEKRISATNCADRWLVVDSWYSEGVRWVSDGCLTPSSFRHV